MRFPLILSSLLFCFISSAQSTYQALSLDETLTKNANAIVRLDEMYVTIENYKSLTVVSKRIVTVLNEDGEQHINAFAFYDNNQKVENLSASIYDASGNELNKYKKKDFVDQSATGGGTLYSDNRVKYLKYTASSYPYTVLFEKSYTTSDTAFVPNWRFLDGYNVSTEKSVFTLELIGSMPFRYKENNLEEFGVISSKKDNKLIYSVENLSAIKREPYSYSFSKLVPNIKFALEKFHLKGVDGQAKNWDEFGKWIYDALLTGQDKLNPAVITKVKNLTKDLTNPREKVKKVYEFVQNNTRYISVQLGIGGWKPISAEEVDRVKYGDCKGLTNYTMALLKEINIPSFYTIVYADSPRRDIDPEFPSLQGNHVFLNVPLDSGEMWLECTSQEVPADYLGTFTDNRYVLKVTPEGGRMVKSKKYDDAISKQQTIAQAVITSEGIIKAEVKITSRGLQYDEKYMLPKKKEIEIEEHYKKYWSYIPNLKINTPEFVNNRNEISIEETVAIETEDYISVAGDRWLMAPNMFNRYQNIPKRVRNRNHKIVVSRGFLDEDEFIIQIPENMKVETLLTNENVITDFGEYEVEMTKVSEKELKFKRRLLIKSGEFSKDRYREFRDFMSKIAKNDNAKIVLIKNNSK